jgi:hypothetical protein
MGLMSKIFTPVDRTREYTGRCEVGATTGRDDGIDRAWGRLYLLIRPINRIRPHSWHAYPVLLCPVSRSM